MPSGVSPFQPPRNILLCFIASFQLLMFHILIFCLGHAHVSILYQFVQRLCRRTELFWASVRHWVTSVYSSATEAFVCVVSSASFVFPVCVVFHRSIPNEGLRATFVLQFSLNGKFCFAEGGIKIQVFRKTFERMFTQQQPYLRNGLAFQGDFQLCLRVSRFVVYSMVYQGVSEPTVLIPRKTFDF